MTAQPVMTCRFCGRDDLSPQGHKSHETHCDENPNPGIPHDRQKELGILEGTTRQNGRKSRGTQPDQSNPDQSADSSGGLPSVETLSGSKNQGEPATDGGEPDSCPVCRGSTVMGAADAKESYTDEAAYPHPRAVLAYELARWTCEKPDCAALWGPEYDEPLTMSEVMEA